MTTLRGRWAAGIMPRNFVWIIRDRLAVSERPGGYAPNHRRVRRQEEIIWLSAQGFSRVISLIPSNHNLHAYEEAGLQAAHFPLGPNVDARELLSELYPSLLSWLRTGERLLIHQEELGERVGGVLAGFLYWSGVFPEPPTAISAVEQLLRRQLGAAGRAVVAVCADLPTPVGGGSPLAVQTPEATPDDGGQAAQLPAPEESASVAGEEEPAPARPRPARSRPRRAAEDPAR